MNAASKSAIFFGLLLASCAMTLQAQTMSAVVEGPLAITEQQAIALFYQRNLGLIAANLNIDKARAQEIIAGAIPNPVFSFTAQELNLKMFRPENRDVAVPALVPQIQQLIETAGKRRLRIESSELATEAVNFDVQDVARVPRCAIEKGYRNSFAVNVVP
ncbi:TolC family protein [Nitrosospira sp. Nsp18]|uniref:TolC family protein n=1 Tax=Nitrosospira sp. Nsp18 TaxID=1855334 RepID=UPI00210A43CA|nr:TolC family protein [Nitrosospira sp. Nsp18]